MVSVCKVLLETSSVCTVIAEPCWSSRAPKESSRRFEVLWDLGYSGVCVFAWVFRNGELSLFLLSRDDFRSNEERKSSMLNILTPSLCIYTSW